MTQIMILPHPDICPTGTTIEVTKGVSICKNLLNHNILIEHACEMSCACATCHVIVRAGFESLKPAEEEEEDLLDKAWGWKIILVYLAKQSSTRKTLSSKYRFIASTTLKKIINTCLCLPKIRQPIAVCTFAPKNRWRRR